MKQSSGQYDSQGASVGKAVANGSAQEFPRLFPELGGWSPDPPPGDDRAVEEALFRLAEDLFRPTPVENTLVPAGYTYLGQFVNHDMSCGALAPTVGAVDTPSSRGGPPALDLYCVYGRGPEHEPDLYDPGDRRKLRIGANQAGELDLPRLDEPGTNLSHAKQFERMRRALIPDPRNDQHVLIAQLHLAFLRFHNARVDEGRSFEEAQRCTRWHYQWVVVNDLLAKRLCGAEVVARAAQAAAAAPAMARLPLEFSMAAFRIGHSMVRSSYRLNDKLEQTRNGIPLQLFLDFGLQNSLQGGRDLPSDWTVQWDRFVEFKGSSPQHSMQIGSGIAAPLRWLPMQEVNLRKRSLPFRTLLAGWQTALPSGQDVAQRLGIAQLPGNDPLWLYVLREAKEVAGGERLGPVAAQIVAEVILRALSQDPSSFLQRPDWRPDVTAEYAAREFALVDFLEHSGARMAAGS